MLPSHSLVSSQISSLIAKSCIITLFSWLLSNFTNFNQFSRGPKIFHFDYFSLPSSQPSHRHIHQPHSRLAGPPSVNALARHGIISTLCTITRSDGAREPFLQLLDAGILGPDLCAYEYRRA